MPAFMHPSHWNWLEISAAATIALALGTFWMAWGTRRLGKQALIESGNAHQLASAAEDQRDIAARNEYASRQPIFIPIIPHRDSDTRVASYAVGNALIERHVEASFVSVQPTNNVTVRIVLRNVGQGVGRIIEAPALVLVTVAIGAGLETVGIPNPLVVAPGDTVEIWAIGRPKMTNQLVSDYIVRGVSPYARVEFQYTDLTDTMITDCDILFEQVFEDELRPIDIVNSHPRPFPPRSTS